MPTAQFTEHQRSGEVSKVEGTFKRGKGGFTPSAKKALGRGAELAGNEKPGEIGDVPILKGKYKPDKVSNPMAPSAKKVLEKTKLEGNEKSREY